MVSINYAFKEIISKIVYYGPGLSGKTTNLQHVFKKVPKDTRGELISLATDADRTLYFDFLPVNVGNIRGFQVKFQLYTVPGQVYYNATRKLVLRGVDGLVFVADSQLDKMDENAESLKNLQENLTEYGYNLEEIPFVIQYNKRDLPNIATIEQLQQQLNPMNIPYFEAVATNGSGVFATLKAISKIVIDKAQKSSVERSESKTAVVAAMEASAKPKPEPVAAGVGASRPAAEAKPQVAPAKPDVAEEKPAASGQSEPQQAYGELSEDVAEISIGDSNEIGDTQTTKNNINDKPAITRESDTMANVVVSSTPDDIDQTSQAQAVEDIEETTEHAVLKEEETTVEPTISSKTGARRHHPDILDADKLDYLISKPSKPETPERKAEETVDEESTSVSDPKQTGNSFDKPMMAESKKVKGKKAGLFGWLKKKK